MQKVKIINSITLGGIFSAIYFVLTILSVYFINFLSIISLIIMPVFAAYYASVFSLKNTITFNIVTLIVCFIGGIADPFFPLFYILPTLIVGDIFGLLNHLKIKFFATLFLQTLTYCITNYISIVLAEIIYETSIINLIIPVSYIYDNLSLCLLFILSGVEAIISTVFVSEELKRFNIIKEKEKNVELNGYLTIIISFILMLVSMFISANFANLFTLIIFILSFPLIYEFIKKIKHKDLFLGIFCILLVFLCFYISSINKLFLLRIILIIPLLILVIVNFTKYLYNINRKGGK